MLYMKCIRTANLSPAFTSWALAIAAASGTNNVVPMTLSTPAAIGPLVPTPPPERIDTIDCIKSTFATNCGTNEGFMRQSRAKATMAVVCSASN